MTLDPAIAQLLRLQRDDPRPGLDTLPIEQARIAFERISARLAGVGDSGVDAMDMLVPGRDRSSSRARIYRSSGGGEQQGILYFHGGGFVVGSLDSHDRICRELSRSTGAVVVSAEYRLAPEAPFPQGLDDCLATWRWCVESAAGLGMAPGRLHLGGDSAGANLAIGTALLARDGGVPMPRSLLVVYPCVDLTLSSASWRRYGTGYWFERTHMERFVDCYVDDHLVDDPLVSPINADLRRLPPTTLITAEYDPLADEGSAFVHRLQAAGVIASLQCIPGMVHGAAGFQAVTPRAHRFIAAAAAGFNSSHD